MSETSATDAIHAETEEQFSAYYDGELGDVETATLETHLEGCSDCKTAFKHFRETIEAISGLGKVNAPAGFEHDVESEIGQRSAGRFFGDRKLSDRLPLTVLAFVAIALGVVLYLLLRGSETGSLKGGEPDPVQAVDPSVVPQPR